MALLNHSTSLELPLPALVSGETVNLHSFKSVLPILFHVLAPKEMIISICYMKVDGQSYLEQDTIFHNLSAYSQD